MFVTQGMQSMQCKLKCLTCTAFKTRQNIWHVVHLTILTGKNCVLGSVLKPVNFCWTEIDTQTANKIILISIIINLCIISLTIQHTLQNKRCCSIIYLALFSKFQKTYVGRNDKNLFYFSQDAFDHSISDSNFWTIWIHNSQYQEQLFVIFLYLLSDFELNLRLFELQVNLLDGTVGWKKCKKWNSQKFFYKTIIM